MAGKQPSDGMDISAFFGVLRRRAWIIVAVGTVHPHWEPYLEHGAALSA